MVKEVENYLTVLRRLHKDTMTVMEGLSPEALDWRPIEGEGDLATNSLVAILGHLAGSEQFFIKEIILGQTIHRDRAAEFSTRGVGWNELKSRLETSAKATETALASLTAEQLEETRKFRDLSVTVRWVIVILIQHIAMHIGHMQLTRQLWMAKFPRK
jgi:hypothetical protein